MQTMLMRSKRRFVATANDLPRDARMIHTSSLVMTLARPASA
jgi:hypothetical protein